MALKDTETVAREVIRGNWGNGQDRKNRLTRAGYNYNTIQTRVNQILGVGQSAPAPAPAASSSTTASDPQPNTPAEPPAPPEPGAPPVYAGVKAAPIDTVVFVDEPYDETFYADVLFEDFGGQEILSVTRSDTVNGQDIIYQPFKDLGILRDQNNPNTLLGIQQTSNNFFANFLINLNQKIPEIGDGPNGEIFYIDPNTGNAIIEFINIEDNQQVEIQILNAGIIEDLGV
jgi:hypothetical protein